MLRVAVAMIILSVANLDRTWTLVLSPFLLGMLWLLAAGNLSRDDATKTVLWLRGFREPDQTTAFLSPHEERLSQKFRIVTLDDHQISTDDANFTLSPAPGWISNAIGLLFIGAISILIWMAVMVRTLHWLFHPGSLQDYDIDAIRFALEEWPGVLLAPPLFLFMQQLKSLYFRGRNRRLARFDVGSRTAIEELSRFIEHQKKTTLARTFLDITPRLVIVSSSADVWEKTVRMLIGTCDHVVIDISRPTKSIAQELVILRNWSEPRPRHTIIGAIEKIDKWHKGISWGLSVEDPSGMLAAPAGARIDATMTVTGLVKSEPKEPVNHTSEQLEILHELQDERVLVYSFFETLFARDDEFEKSLPIALQGDSAEASYSHKVLHLDDRLLRAMVDMLAGMEKSGHL